MSHFLERWVHFKCHRSAKATTVNAGLIHLLSPSAYNISVIMRYYDISLISKSELSRYIGFVNHKFYMPAQMSITASIICCAIASQPSWVKQRRVGIVHPTTTLANRQLLPCQLAKLI